MTVTIDGTTGVSLVQDGVITDANLPAGSVLQVVQGSTSTSSSNTTASFADTGLSASITPSSTSSKILIIVDQHAIMERRGDQNIGMGYRILRDSTVVAGGETNSELYFSDANGNTNLDIYQRQNRVYLDSPSTTSAITYKTQGRPDQTANGGKAGFNIGGITSYITLMEIAG